MSKPRQFIQFLTQLSNRQLAIIAVLLCLPAFLIHLGLIAFIGDESIRSLVAFEMKMSGNFIVPTLNGEFYFNKPPLYNWMIYGMSMLMGQFGEWPARLTTLVSLGGFAWWVYHFVSRYMDKLTGLTMALMVLTSGRILFWDSMLGLIDICFSAVIYLNFMVMFQFSKAGKWSSMFLFSYLLMSVAFLLKGLPAIVFQGISILTTLILFKSFKQKFFSAAHLLGALAGTLPVIVYYILYARYISLTEVFSVLTDQSVQRTVVRHSLWDTFVHLFTFPLEEIYHFLPWSLLILPYFHPRFRTWLRENEFVRFNFWMMMANLPVYWLSVQVFPRYLLMFIPLFNLTGYYILQRSLATNLKWWKSLHVVFIVLVSLGSVAALLMLVYPPVSEIPGSIWIWWICSLILIICGVGLVADAARMFIWMALALLVVRSTFNLVVLPLRAIDYQENLCRQDCQRLYAHHPDDKLVVYDQTQTQGVARFYLSSYFHQVLPITRKTDDTSALYIVDRSMYPDFPGTLVDSLLLERDQVMGVMRLAK
jgi:4-amino-4-deoxy-L-arabinose transferase-like glycosyltransferase